MLKSEIWITTRATALGLATSLAFWAGPVAAEGDLYFMHNGSRYLIWTDRDACVNDMRHNNNNCVIFRVCGSDYFSTQATLNVGVDKYNRNERFSVKGTYNNGVVCNIQK